MGASFAAHVLFLLWFSAATFSLTFFKVESNEVSCNEEEKQALLSLKRGLIDPGNRLSSWSNQQDGCKWDGVRCDDNTGRPPPTQILKNHFILYISIILLQTNRFCQLV